MCMGQNAIPDSGGLGLGLRFCVFHNLSDDDSVADSQNSENSVGPSLQSKDSMGLYRKTFHKKTLKMKRI